MLLRFPNAGAAMIRRMLLGLLLMVTGAVAALPWVRNLEHGPLDERARQGAPGRFVTLTHGQVHYELAGPAEGPPVVLVHGFSVPGYIWDPTFRALADAGFRVLRFDLYGRGWSDRPDVGYDRDLFADQLAELMDSQRMPRAALVGLSMGGAIVGRFATRFPQRIDRVALIAPLTRGRDIGVLQWPLVGEWVMRVWALPRMADGQLSDFVEPEGFPDWPDRFRPQLAYDGYGRAILSTMRHTIVEDSLSDFAAIGEHDLPTLLIWGRQDTVVPYDDNVAVRAAIPQAQFLPIDQAGHLPHLERAEQVAPALIAFLRAKPLVQ